jgi:predicted neuraminidase
LIISELSESFEVVDEIIITEKIDEKEDVNTLELSYPYLIEHNNQLHLCYTYGRKKIEHVTIEI